MLQRLVVLLTLILTLCSCGGRQKRDHKRVTGLSNDLVSHKKEIREILFSESRAQQQEAKLMDVPIPLYTTRLPLVTYDTYGNQIVLGYQSESSINELIDLYREQMSRHGWNLTQSFTGSEALLHFEKPSRACLVSIRPHTKSLFGKESVDLILYVEDSGVVW